MKCINLKCEYIKIFRHLKKMKIIFKSFFMIKKGRKNYCK